MLRYHYTSKVNQIILILWCVKKNSSPWSCDSWRRMGGHGEPGLEVPGVTDCATDMTAEGGMRAASWSTLGLIGSSTNKNNSVMNLIIATEM